MTERKALVVLDCDGVIFPFAPQMAKHGAWPDLREVTVAGYDMTISETVRSELQRLMKLGVDFMWSTAWFDRTELFPAALGFKEWPWARPERGRGTWEKLVRIQRISEDTDVLWVDDDLKDDEEAVEWLKTVKHVTAISPNIHVGISALELQQITAWVESRATR